MMILPKSPIYSYSNYWRTWSRVLMMENGWYLEFSLTPIYPATTWGEDFPTIKLRWHNTARNVKGGDYNATNVPSYVAEQMFDSGLPIDLIRSMLEGDIWSQIDWTEFLRIEGEHLFGHIGGIPLSQVQREAAPRS